MGLGKRISKLFGASGARNEQHLHAGFRRSAEGDVHVPRGISVPSWRHSIGLDQDPSLLTPMGRRGADFSELSLSSPSCRFLRNVSVSSLSHVLIWYIYHDIVPTREESPHWFMQLSRDLMVGWIRLGSELEHSSAGRRIPPPPLALESIIDELGIEWQQVYRRLIRLSDLNEMTKFEMTGMHLHTPTGYHAITEKLRSDEQLVSALRPVRATRMAVWQVQILDWIHNHSELVVRPVVASMNSLSVTPSPITSDQRSSARRHFDEVCNFRSVGPMESLYDEAFESTRRSVGSRGVTFALDTLSSPSNEVMKEGVFVSAAPWDVNDQRQRRRRSAPQVDASHKLLLSFQDSLDALKAEINAIRSQREHAQSGQDCNEEVQTYLTERLNGASVRRGPTADLAGRPNPAPERLPGLQREMRKPLRSFLRRTQRFEIPRKVQEYFSPVEERPPTRGRSPTFNEQRGAHDVLFPRHGSRNTPDAVAVPDTAGWGILPNGGYSVRNPPRAPAEVEAPEQQHTPSSDPFAEELGSVWAQSRQNSLQESDPDDILHAHASIPPLRPAAKEDKRRHAFYVHNPSSSHSDLPTPRPASVHGLVDNFREQSSSSDVGAKQEDHPHGNDLYEDLSRYEETNGFEDFDDDHSRSESPLHARPVAIFKHSPASRRLAECVEPKDQGNQIPIPLQRSKYRPLDLRSLGTSAVGESDTVTPLAPSLPMSVQFGSDRRCGSRSGSMIPGNSDVSSSLSPETEDPAEHNDEQDSEEVRRVRNIVDKSKGLAQAGRRSKFRERLE